VDDDTETEEEEEYEDEEEEEEEALSNDENENDDANGDAPLRVRFTMKRSREDFEQEDDEEDDDRLRHASRRRADGAGAGAGAGGSLRARRSHAAYSWLLRDESPKLGDSYVPQLGDEVVYVPHGHHAFLEHSVNKAADRPWLSLGAPGSWRHAEPARVCEMRYAISQDGRDETVAVLRLRLADPASSNFGAEFTIELPRLEDADFLVPAHRYRAASARRWRTDDRCAVCWQDAGADGALTDAWYRGVVVGETSEANERGETSGAAAAAWRGSPWNALTVEYYNISDPEDKTQDHSFWELHDEEILGRGAKNDKGELVDADAPRLDDATSRKLADRVRRARAKPAYDVFVDEIEANASFPQRDGSDANYCALVPVPVCLDLVARRLRNRYYRSIGGFTHDVSTIRSNCELFNGLDSEYTEAAAKLERELINGYSEMDLAAPVEGVAAAATMPPPVAVTSPGRGRRR
jgi:hypothetical protein